MLATFIRCDYKINMLFALANIAPASVTQDVSNLELHASLQLQLEACNGPSNFILLPLTSLVISILLIYD